MIKKITIIMLISLIARFIFAQNQIEIPDSELKKEGGAAEYRLLARIRIV